MCVGAGRQHEDEVEVLHKKAERDKLARRTQEDNILSQRVQSL